MVKSYKDLIAWQKAMDLVKSIYMLAKTFPKTEQYRLIDQLTRAAVSVPSNIVDQSASAHKAPIDASRYTRMIVWLCVR